MVSLRFWSVTLYTFLKWLAYTRSKGGAEKFFVSALDPGLKTFPVKIQNWLVNPLTTAWGASRFPSVTQGEKQQTPAFKNSGKETFCGGTPRD
jgi:hypothetical protein